MKLNFFIHLSTPGLNIFFQVKIYFITLLFSCRYRIQMILLQNTKKHKDHDEGFVSLDVFCANCSLESSWISRMVNWIKKDVGFDCCHHVW